MDEAIHDACAAQAAHGGVAHRDMGWCCGVVQGRGQGGGGSQARGSLFDLCVFVGCSGSGATT